MTIASWLRGLTRRTAHHLKKSRPSTARTRSARYRPSVETLEDRRCLAYSVIDLGTLGATYTSSTASAVNASGQVVGQSSTAAGYNRAFLWQNGSMTDLGTLGGLRSGAADINDAGQIVGGSNQAGETSTHAFLWQSGSMTDLGTLGGDSSGASAINNSGQIVGYSKTAAGAYHTFVWEGGVMFDLNNLLPANSGWDLVGVSNPMDINDNGQIVGQGLINGKTHAFRLTDNDGVFANGGAVIIDLGTLGGSGSAAAGGINGSGQVVGRASTTDGSQHAFRYSGGVMTDLKNLVNNPTAVPHSNANAINDAGQIVGYSGAGNTGLMDHAFLWQNGKMTDLNKQLPRGSAWVLESASDINGAGQIVGRGSIGGQGHAFLMVPGAALQAESISTAVVTETIGLGQVQSLLGEALARWQAASVDTSGLGNLQVHIADLGGTTLGLASGNTIYLDDNAAGWGWFVDATPKDDSEFALSGNQGEQNRMDLLTVVMHELGHLLGHDHEEEGEMADTVGTGIRRTPESGTVSVSAAIVDLLFSDGVLTKRRR